MRRRLLTVFFILTCLLSAGNVRLVHLVLAQGSDDGAGQRGPVFVSGDWRISLVAASKGDTIGAAGLESVDGKQWVLVVADITNLTDKGTAFQVGETGISTDKDGGSGATTATTTTDLNLREGPGTDASVVTTMPAGATVDVTGAAENGFLPVTYEGTSGWASESGLSVGEGGSAAIAADPTGTETATGKLKTEAITDGATGPVGAGKTARVSLAYSMPGDAETLSFVSGTSIDLGDLLGQRTRLSDLGPVISPVLDEIKIDKAVDGQTVQLHDGSKIRLIGVDAPTDRDCFADDATGALNDLTDGTVYLERGPSSADDSSLGYLWVARDGSKLLVNQQLIANGDAGVSFDGQDGESRFNQWLEQTGDQAKDQGAGLWAKCTGVHGKSKPKPTATPTPTPNAAERRAQYTPLADARDLEIRPGSYEGERISFSGEIFTLQVAPRGRGYAAGDEDPQFVQVYMQVWVTGADGSQQPVVIGYNGDTTGMFEGTWVTIYGVGHGTDSGVNGFGGTIVQPFVMADIIDVG